MIDPANLALQGIINQASPPLLSPHPLHRENKERAVPVIAQEVLRNNLEPPKVENPGIWDRIKNGAIAFGLKVADKVVMPIGKERDVKILQEILTQRNDPVDLIAELTPQVREFAQQWISEGFWKNFVQDDPEAAKDLMDKVFLRILTNLSLDLLPEEEKQKALAGEPISNEFKIPSDQLLEKISTRLIHLIGTEVNEIDQAVYEKPYLVTDERFRQLAQKIYDRIFPPGDGFRYFEDKVIQEMSGKFKEWYVSFSEFIEEGEIAKGGVGINFQPLEKGIGQFGAFVQDWLHEKWFKKDQQFFKDLTGEDVANLAEKISPELYGRCLQFLPESLLKIAEKGNNPAAIDRVTKSVVLHAFACIARELFQGELRRGESLEFEEILRKVNAHLMEKMKGIFDEIKKKEHAGEKITSDLFAQHSGDLLKLFLPDLGEHKWLDQFFERRKVSLTHPINEVLFSIYQAQPNQKSLDEYKQRMRELLWDRSWVKSVPGWEGPVPENPTQSDALRAGIEGTIGQIYNLAAQLAQPCAKGIAEWMKNPHQILELYFPLEGKPQDPDAEEDPNIKWATHQIQKSLEITLFKGFVHLFEKVPPEKRFPPENLLIYSFQSLLKLGIEHFPTVSTQIENQISQIREEITARFSYIEDPEKKRVAIAEALKLELENKWGDLEDKGAELLAPFVDELIALPFEENGTKFEDLLPVPKNARDSLGKFARKGMAQQFSKMMMAVTSWTRERKNNEQRLDELYHTKNPHKLCNVLGQMARAGIPWVLQEQGGKIAENVVLPVLEPFLREVGSEDLIQKGNLTLVSRMLKGFFESIGDNHSPEMEKLFEYIGLFTETTLLRLAADFSKRLKTMEEVYIEEVPFTAQMEAYKERWVNNAPDPSKNRPGDVIERRKVIREMIEDKKIENDQLFAFFKFANIKPDGRFLKGREKLFRIERKMNLADFFEKYEKMHASLLEDTSLELVDKVTQHFKALGEVKHNLNAENEAEIEREELIEELGRLRYLHPAIADPAKNDQFFLDWSRKIFKIIGIDKEGPVPIPALFKDTAWHVIEDKLIPLLLKLMFDAGSQPGNLNKGLVSILQGSIDSAKSDKDSFLARLLPDNDQLNERLEELKPRFKDGFQEDLEKKIGECLEALIQMQPNKTPQLLLNFATIKAKASAAIGQPLRSELLRKADGKPRSCLELLNTAMGFVDNIVDVEWDEQKECVVYPKTGLDGKKESPTGGTTEYVDRPNLGRFFPQTEQEKKLAQELDERERKRAEEEVPKCMRRIMNEQTRQLVVKLFTEKWDRLEAKIKERLKNYPKLSEWIIGFLTVLVKLPGLLSVYFLDIFIWSIVNAILGLILSRQIEGHAKNVQLNIHDNVFYHIIEHIMKKYVKGINNVNLDDVAPVN